MITQKLEVFDLVRRIYYTYCNKRANLGVMFGRDFDETMK